MLEKNVEKTLEKNFEKNVHRCAGGGALAAPIYIRVASEMRHDGELCPVGRSLIERRRTFLHIRGKK